jgi:hypothetical protein
MGLFFTSQAAFSSRRSILKAKVAVVKAIILSFKPKWPEDPQ